MASVFEHEKAFKTDIEMQEYLDNMVEKDIYSENMISEGNLLELPDCPIATTSIMQNLGIPQTEENEDAVREAMATTRMVWRGPVQGRLQVVPVSAIAIPSLSGRAGLYGPSIRLKPEILNEGFPLYDGIAKTLIRKGSLLASHSSKYEWLRQNELFTVLTVSLTNQFSGYEFVSGYYSDSVTIAKFAFPSEAANILAAYNQKAKKTGEAIEKDLVPGLVFATSDVAEAGANLYPLLFKKNEAIRIGTPLKLSHDDKHAVGDFVENCDKVLDILKESTNRLSELMDIELLYPENCFQNLVKQFKLPVGSSEKAFEDFCAKRGLRVSAHTIYFAIANIIGYEEAAGASVSKLMDLEGTIARILFADFKQYDTAILR